MLAVQADELRESDLWTLNYDRLSKDTGCKTSAVLSAGTAQHGLQNIVSLEDSTNW